MNRLADSWIDSLARSRGWVDYPSDSIEQGDTWHCDPERAPFGRIYRKTQFRSNINDIWRLLKLYPEVAAKFMEDFK